MKLAVDHLQPTKVLILVGYRHIVLQLDSYFPNHTHILAGKPHNPNALVHLGSFQTLQSRISDIDLSSYDLLIIDEYHSRQSSRVKSIIKQFKQSNSTVLLFTGTPLTNSNKLITQLIDHTINSVTVSEMLDNNWLAPTIFKSN